MAATAAAVAATAHGLSMRWGAAWVLGTELAPNGATALAALDQILPPRNRTIPKAEILINDSTALVVYDVAVVVTIGEIHLSAAGVSVRFVLAHLGGAAAGLAITFPAIQLLRRLNGEGQLTHTEPAEQRPSHGRP